MEKFKSINFTEYINRKRAESLFDLKDDAINALEEALKRKKKIAYPELIDLQGSNGEIVYVRDDTIEPNVEQNIKLIVELPLDLKSGDKDPRATWVRLGFDYFTPLFSSVVETSTEGEDFKILKDDSYPEFKLYDQEQGWMTTRLKGYADINPKGTGSKAAQKKRYRQKRNEWIKKKYKQYIKNTSQDKAYKVIHDELKKLSLSKFGEWPDKEIDKESGKWKPIGTDPRDLSCETIKSIVQR